MFLEKIIALSCTPMCKEMVLAHLFEVRSIDSDVRSTQMSRVIVQNFIKYILLYTPINPMPYLLVGFPARVHQTPLGWPTRADVVASNNAQGVPTGRADIRDGDLGNSRVDLHVQ